MNHCRFYLNWKGNK